MGAIATPAWRPPQSLDAADTPPSPHWTDAVSGYVVATEFGRQKFIEGGLPAEKIYVKPNFVEPDPGERTTPGDYALFVGRLSPEKGLSALLGAWSQIGPEIPLVIAGDGPLRASLESEVSKTIFATSPFGEDSTPTRLARQ